MQRLNHFQFETLWIPHNIFLETWKVGCRQFWFGGWRFWTRRVGREHQAQNLYSDHNKTSTSRPLFCWRFIRVQIKQLKFLHFDPCPCVQTVRVVYLLVFGHKYVCGSNNEWNQRTVNCVWPYDKFTMLISLYGEPDMTPRWTLLKPEELQNGIFSLKLNMTITSIKIELFIPLNFRFKSLFTPSEGVVANIAAWKMGVRHICWRQL